MTEDFARWIREQTRASNRQLASVDGVDAAHTTVANQLGSDVPDIGMVVAIARAYRLPFVETFRRAGYITAEEAASISAPRDLSTFSELELVTETLRRVAAGTATELITEPAPEELIEQVLREARSNVVTPSEDEDPSKVDLRQEEHDLAATTDDSVVDPDRLP